MDDEEELKAQCYGGEYTSEVFDPMLKRMSYRKQKRWWNAYMLFYTRADLVGDDGTSPGSVAAQLAKLRITDAVAATASQQQQQKSKKSATTTLAAATGAAAKKLSMPHPIEKSIQKQNVNFLHQRNLFSPEFFQFMRKAIGCNGSYVGQQQQQQEGGSKQLPPDAEDIRYSTNSLPHFALLVLLVVTHFMPCSSMMTVHLASKFLFNIGFRTKKSLRGSAQEWYELLTQYMRGSRQVHDWRRYRNFYSKISVSSPPSFFFSRFVCGFVRRSCSPTPPAFASTSLSAPPPRSAPPSSASSSSWPTSPWRTGRVRRPRSCSSTMCSSSSNSSKKGRWPPTQVRT